jgi:hypothetical protein
MLLDHHCGGTFFTKEFFQMKRILATLLFLWLVVSMNAQSPVTVYYQPTPYPLYKYDGTAMSQDINIVHLWDGWLNNSYNTTLVRDNKLQLGGWGDNYRTHIQFDLEGLPANVTLAYLYLWSYPRGDGSTMVNFDLWRQTGAWNSGLTWSTQPTVTYQASYAYGSTNAWWGFNISSLYNSWKSGSITNYGLRMDPWTTSNQFDMFYSSRNAADGQRPILGLTFTPPSGMPNFKMPLPSGANWLVSTEVGGYGCTGGAPWPDTAHAGDNYFTLDFPSPGIKDNGTSYSNPVPILAPASGTVHSVGWAASTGYYIILDHGNGYLTRYIHFDNPAARKNGTLLSAGNTVYQGDQIGVMGNSGNSSGAHLHINFWYNNTFNGGSGVTNLSYVVMDGWLLKSFQTECAVNGSGVPTSAVSWIRYYHSSNTPTGN